MKTIALLAALACAVLPSLAQTPTIPTTLTYRGAYDPTISYSRGDEVYFGGALYASGYTHTGYAPNGPQNSKTTGYAAESGGQPAWYFLASGPLATGTALGLSFSAGNAAASPVAYLGGCDTTSDGCAVTNMPDGTTSIVAVTGYSTNSVPTVTDAGNGTGSESDLVRTLTQIAGSPLCTPSACTYYFLSPNQKRNTSSDGQANGFEHFFSIQGWSNGTPQYKSISAFVVTGASLTSPLDGSLVTTPVAQDSESTVTCNAVTPTTPNEFAISVLTIDSGTTGIPSVNLTQDTTAFPAGQRQFAYGAASGLGSVQPVWSDISSGGLAACASLLLH